MKARKIRLFRKILQDEGWIFQIIMAWKICAILVWALFFSSDDPAQKAPASGVAHKKSPRKAPEPTFDPQVLADCVSALRQLGMSAKKARDSAEFVLSSGVEKSVEGTVREVLRMNAGRL